MAFAKKESVKATLYDTESDKGYMSDALRKIHRITKFAFLPDFRISVMHSFLMSKRICIKIGSIHIVTLSDSVATISQFCVIVN